MTSGIAISGGYLVAEEKTAWHGIIRTLLYLPRGNMVQGRLL